MKIESTFGKYFRIRICTLNPLISVNSMNIVSDSEKPKWTSIKLAVFF